MDRAGLAKSGNACRKFLDPHSCSNLGTGAGGGGGGAGVVGETDTETFSTGSAWLAWAMCLARCRRSAAGVAFYGLAKICCTALIDGAKK